MKRHAAATKAARANEQAARAATEAERLAKEAALAEVERLQALLNQSRNA